MESNPNKKTGIITFHASYNCGSMLQAYALQKFLNKNEYENEIIDFSSKGQRCLYSVFFKNNSIKNIIKNLIVFFNKKQISKNYKLYEKFKRENFNLSCCFTSENSEIKDNYKAVISGADQIWNITISDYDDAYFLNWVKNARKIAYAPSFGAKNPKEYASDIDKYKEFLMDYDYLSIRENNGKKWINELIDKEVPLVLDPTLIIDKEDYEELISDELKLPDKYIFYYSPGFTHEINSMVKQISKKYKIPVITFNSKAYYLRGVNLTGFKLPESEKPSTYLQLMKNASLVITTSFHGTIFPTLYRKKFWVIKNGNMFLDDDRVLTLVNQLGLNDRLIGSEYNDNFNYMSEVDYDKYDNSISDLKSFSQKYLLDALEGK